jgi:hypothetical protein
MIKNRILTTSQHLLRLTFLLFLILGVKGVSSCFLLFPED